MPTFDTAANIVNDAAVELGLIGFGAKPLDPFGSSDSNLGQLCQLLKSVGRKLVRARQWTHLQQSWAFNTGIYTRIGSYALPPDQDRIVDQTWWNRSNRLPVGGPLSPQQFQAFKASLSGVVFNLLFRTLNGQFQAYPDTATPAYIIAFEYISKLWVLPSGTRTTVNDTSTAPLLPWGNALTWGNSDYATSGGNIYKISGGGGTSGDYNPQGKAGFSVSDGLLSWLYQTPAGTDQPTAGTDTIQLDAQLVTRALKLAFLNEKGFPTSSAEDDYEQAEEQAFSADTQARVLSLSSHGANPTAPLLGLANIPLTGFGS